MSWKEKFKFFYGVMLGTSVKYYEPHKELGQTQFLKIDEGLYILKQKDHECGILLNKDQILLINTSYGHATEDLVNFLKNTFPDYKVTEIIYSRFDVRAMGGAHYFPGHRGYVPAIPNRPTIIGVDYDRLKLTKIEKEFKVPWGDTTLNLKRETDSLTVDLGYKNIKFKQFLFQF